VFGRATITFGIGPHSSKMCDKCKCVLKDHPSGAVRVLVSPVFWFIGSQVACWTHARVHLRFADTSRRYTPHDLHCMPHRLTTSSYRGHVDEPANHSQLLGAHKQVTYDGDLVLE